MIKSVEDLHLNTSTLNYLVDECQVFHRQAQKVTIIYDIVSHISLDNAHYFRSCPLLLSTGIFAAIQHPRSAQAGTRPSRCTSGPSRPDPACNAAHTTRIQAYYRRCCG